jgi:hypothetical protein
VYTQALRDFPLHPSSDSTGSLRILLGLIDTSPALLETLLVAKPELYLDLEESLVSLHSMLDFMNEVRSNFFDLDPSPSLDGMIVIC